MISDKNKGERITSVEQIYDLMLEKKCIYHSGMNVRIPAAVAIHWTGELLVKSIREERLYVYIKTENTPRFKK
jgi:hypothetical protein